MSIFNLISILYYLIVKVLNNKIKYKTNNKNLNE